MKAHQMSLEVLLGVDETQEGARTNVALGSGTPIVGWEAPCFGNFLSLEGTGRSGFDFRGQVSKAFATKRVARFRIVAHGKNCYHPRIEIRAPMTNEQATFGTNLEPALGYGHWIFDQLDSDKITFCFQ